MIFLSFLLTMPVDQCKAAYLEDFDSVIVIETSEAKYSIYLRRCKDDVLEILTSCSEWSASFRNPTTCMCTRSHHGPC